MELRDPAAAEATGCLTDTARMLAAHDRPGLAHVADRIDDAEAPAAVVQASRFIGDCADDAWCCRAMPNGEPECALTDFDGLPSGRRRNLGRCASPASTTTSPATRRRPRPRPADGYHRPLAARV